MNMEYFFDGIIGPYISGKKYRNICEIGASLGGNTDKLLTIGRLALTVIDPCLDADLCEKYKANPMVRMYKGASFDVLPGLSETFDCILIDGDHNWYTVYNELKNIEEHNLLAGGGTIFFHDVSWPYGRRDLYYVPENIPPEYRHPYAKKGIVRGSSELSDNSGINSYMYNAIYEGGPRNGVLTAIEDFLKDCKSKYYFFYLKHDVGLGVLARTEGLGIANFLAKWQLRIKMLAYKISKKIRKHQDKRKAE